MNSFLRKNWILANIGIDILEKFARIQSQERENLMLTFLDYVELFALIGFCAFITYTVHEVGNAIHSMLHDEDMI